MSEMFRRTLGPFNRPGIKKKASTEEGPASGSEPFLLWQFCIFLQDVATQLFRFGCRFRNCPCVPIWCCCVIRRDETEKTNCNFQVRIKQLLVFLFLLCVFCHYRGACREARVVS